MNSRTVAVKPFLDALVRYWDTFSADWDALSSETVTCAPARAGIRWLARTWWLVWFPVSPRCATPQGAENAPREGPSSAGCCLHWSPDRDRLGL